MIAFWTLVVLMLAAAVGLLLRPLLGKAAVAGDRGRNELNVSLFKDRLVELRRELEEGNLGPEAYEQARHELEKDLLINTSGGEQQGVRSGGRWAAPVVAVLVPLMAVGLYFQLGSPDLADGRLAGDHRQQGMPDAGDMAAVVEKLQARLEEQPDNVDGWVLLARSLMALQRYDDAAKALGRARAVGGDDPALLAEHAEVLAMAQGGSLAGEPMELIKRALGQDGAQPHALWLAGVAAFQQDNPAKAIDYWTRLLEVVPPGSETEQMVRGNIEQARAELGGVPAVEESGGAADVRIEAEVSVAPAVADRVDSGDTLFVFARPADSGSAGMPVAVVRKSAAELPVTVVLDDSQSAPMGGKLSDLAEVLLVARISKSGNAAAQSGDLEGRAQVTTSGGPVRIVIDKVVP